MDLMMLNVRSLLRGALGACGLARPVGLAVLLGSGVLIAALANSLPVLAAAPQPVPVFDLHVDLPYQVVYKGRPAARGRGRYVAGWLSESGVRSALMPLFIPHSVSSRGPRQEDLETSYRRMWTLFRETPPYRLGVCGPGPAGVVGTQWAFEGAAPLGRHLNSIWRWAERGVRSFALVHTHDNLLSGSSGASAAVRQSAPGLSPLGVELMRRVHAVGGVIDVSHASDRAVDEVLRRSEAEGVPVIATHSNARALAPHSRNLTDEQIRRVARSGGVVGVNFHSRFLLGSSATAKVGDVVRHIRHIARVGGIGAVAIGSDFEGGIRPPPELKDVRGFPHLAEALGRAGFSRKQVAQIFHGNASRVLCSAERQL